MLSPSLLGIELVVELVVSDALRAQWWNAARGVTVLVRVHAHFACTRALTAAVYFLGCSPIEIREPYGVPCRFDLIF